MDDTGEQLQIRDSFLRKMAAKQTPEERHQKMFEMRQAALERLQSNPTAWEAYKRNQFRKRAVDERPEDFE